LELARGYLAGHGPAVDRDLANWAGLPLRDARAGLGSIATELQQRGYALVALAGAPEVAEPPSPRLLGAFDPVLLGWVSRGFVVGAHERAIVSGGIFRAFALVDGVAGGLWRIAGSEAQLEPFDELSPEHASALRADGEDVIRYLAARVARYQNTTGRPHVLRRT